jgi:hypothetical protein
MLEFEFEFGEFSVIFKIRIRRIFANSNSNWANFSPPLVPHMSVIRQETDNLSGALSL